MNGIIFALDWFLKMKNGVVLEEDLFLSKIALNFAKLLWNMRKIKRLCPYLHIMNLSLEIIEAFFLQFIEDGDGQHGEINGVINHFKKLENFLCIN